MRCRLAAGAIGLGCAGLMIGVMIAPAPARADYGRGGYGDGGCSAPEPGQCPVRSSSGAGADCERVATDMQEGGGDLKVTTDVPDGADVAPGQDIRVTLTWDPKAWADRDLDAALACVRVKGAVDPDLSGGERPSANDGTFEYVLHIPDNIRAGCDVCIQGVLAGTAGDGGPQQVTGDGPCFMSGPPKPPGPPATRPPTPPATRPSPPPPAPPATTATTAPRIPTEVGGVQATRPGPAPLTPAPTPSGPEVAPSGELPRTGSPVVDLATASGGLTLTFGGLSLIGGAGRRRTRRRK